MTWQPYLLAWSRSAAGELSGIQKEAARDIVDALERYAATGVGDVKRLKGRLPIWRLRVGDYRIQFTVNRTERALGILGVAHRREAYR